MEKLSGYILTRNSELFLDEIIIVDSGSTDKTEKITKKGEASIILKSFFLQ